jgi:anaerobic selenocysteine-containing dehydrogenase
MYEGEQSGAPVDPLPAYVPPFESPASNPTLAQHYPLSIVSPKPHAFLNTQYGNEQQKKLRQGEQIVFLHPIDAASRAIVAGTVVRVFNERGFFEGPAELSEDLMPGLVMANVGHWPGSTISGTSVNAISSDRHSAWAWPAPTRTIWSR